MGAGGASGNDFYVSFDSDVVEFADEINRKLRTAAGAIKTFESALNDLNVSKLQSVGHAMRSGGGALPSSVPSTGGSTTVTSGASGDGYAAMKAAGEQIAQTILRFEGTLDTTLKNSIAILESTSISVAQHAAKSAREVEKARARGHVTDATAYTNDPKYVPNPKAKRPPRAGDMAQGGVTSGVARPGASLVSAPTGGSGKFVVLDAASFKDLDLSKLSFAGVEKAIDSGTKQTHKVRESVDKVKSAIDALAAKLTAGIPTTGTAASGGAATSSSAAVSTLTPKQQKQAQALLKKNQQIAAEIAKLRESGDTTALAAAEVEQQKLMAQAARITQTTDQKRQAREQRKIDARQNPSITGAAGILSQLGLARTIARPGDDTIEGRSANQTRDAFTARRGSPNALADPKKALRDIVDTFRRVGIDPAEVLTGDPQKAYKRMAGEQPGQWKGQFDKHSIAGYMSMVGQLGKHLNERTTPLAAPENATAEVKKMFQNINRGISRTQPAQMDDTTRAFFRDMGASTPAAVSDALEVLRKNSLGGGSQRSVIPVNRPAGRGKVKWGSLWPSQGSPYGHGPVADPNDLGAPGPMSMSAPAEAKRTVEAWAKEQLARAMQMAQSQASGSRKGRDERFIDPYRSSDEFVTGNDAEAKAIRRGAGRLRQAYDVLDADPLRYLDMQDAAAQARAKEATVKNKKAKIAAAKKAERLESAAYELRLQSPELYTDQNLADVRTRQASREALETKRLEAQKTAETLRSQRSDVREGMRGAFVGDLMPGIRVNEKGGISLTDDLRNLARKSSRQYLGKGATEAQISKRTKDLPKGISGAYRDLQKFIEDPERFIETSKVQLPKELATSLDQFEGLVGKQARGTKMSAAETEQLETWKKFLSRDRDQSKASRDAEFQTWAAQDPEGLKRYARQMVTGGQLQTNYYNQYDRLMGPTGIGIRKPGEVGFGAPTYNVAAPGVRMHAPTAAELIGQGLTPEEVASKLNMPAPSVAPFREASRAQYKQNAEAERKAAAAEMSKRVKARNDIINAAGLNLPSLQGVTKQDLLESPEAIKARQTMEKPLPKRPQRYVDADEAARGAAGLERLKAMRDRPGPITLDQHNADQAAAAEIMKRLPSFLATPTHAGKATKEERDQENQFQNAVKSRDRAAERVGKTAGDPLLRMIASLETFGVWIDDKINPSLAKFKQHIDLMNKANALRGAGKPDQALALEKQAAELGATPDALFKEFKKLADSGELVLSQIPKKTTPIPTEKGGMNNRVLAQGEQSQASKDTGVFVDQAGNVVRAPEGMDFATARSVYTKRAAELQEAQVTTSQGPTVLGPLKDLAAKQAEARKQLGIPDRKSKSARANLPRGNAEAIMVGDVAESMKTLTARFTKNDGTESEVLTGIKSGDVETMRRHAATLRDRLKSKPGADLKGRLDEVNAELGPMEAEFTEAFGKPYLPGRRNKIKPTDAQRATAARMKELRSQRSDLLELQALENVSGAAGVDSGVAPVRRPRNAAAAVAQTAGVRGKVDTDDDVAAINRVTAAINALHQTIKAGVGVRAASGAAAGAEAPLSRVLGRHRGRRGVSVEAETADVPVTVGAEIDVPKLPRAPKPRQAALSAQGRDSVLAEWEKVAPGLRTAARLGASARSADKPQAALEVGAKAVRAGAANAADASKVLADVMVLTTKEAKVLETQLSQVANEERALGKASRTVSEELRRNGEAQRNQAGMLGRVSDLSPKAHLLGKELGAMIGKATQPEIRAKMEEVLRQVQAEMPGATRGAMNNKAQSLMGAYGFQPRGSEIKEVARSLSGEGAGGAAQVKAAGQQMGGYYAASLSDGMAGTLQRSLFGSHGFWSRVMNSAGLFMVRNFAAGAVFGLTNALQEVISVALQTEATFVRVSHALEATGRSADGLRTGLLRISTDYGVALKDVYTTASGLTGVFDTVDEIEGATRVVTQLQMISNGALNATEGMGALASASAAFGLYSVDSLQHVADVMTVIQQNLGTNLEISLEGLGSFSGQAVQLGLSLEESAVYVSQIAKMTNSQGAAAGEQFGRILSVMQTGRGQSSLRDAFGQDMGNALDTRDYSTALRILMADYQGLTKAQQDSVATTLGGQRQMRALQALFLDGTKVLNTITKAEQAHGQAESMSAEIASKLNVQFQKLRTNLQAFGMELVRSGALNFLGVALRTVNFSLTAVSEGISKINDLIDKSPLLGAFRGWTGAILGMVVAMKLAKTVAQSLMGSMAAMSAFVTAQGARAGVVGPGGVVAGLAGLSGARAGSGRLTPGSMFDRTLGRSRFAATEGVGMLAAGGMFNPGRRDRYRDSRLSQGLGTSLERRNFWLGEFDMAPPVRQNWAQRSSDKWAQRATKTSLAQGSARYLAPEFGGSTVFTGPARGMRAMEAGATGMSKALHGAGTAVAFLSANAGALSVAAIAVAATLAALWADSQHQKQVRENTTAEYDRLWGKNKGKTEEQVAAEQQKSSLGQLRADDLDKSRAIGLERVGGGYKALFEGLKYYTTFGTLGRSRDDSKDRYYGDLNKDAPQQQEFFKLADSVGGVKTENGMTSDVFTRMRAQAKAGLINFDDVQKATEEVKKETEAFADKIQNDPDLSAMQKENLLAQVQDLEVRWDDSVTGIVEGFTGVRILTSDMLKSLQSMVSAASGTDSVALREVTQGLQAMVDQSGLGGDEKAVMEKAMGLTSPVSSEGAGVTKRKERLAAAMEESKNLMNQAEAAYLDKVAGGDDAQIETAQADFLSAVSAYGQSRQTYLDYTVQQAQAEATRLLFGGDYEGAASQYEEGAAALREEAAKLAAAGDTSGAADKTNQANQAAAQAGQARIRAVTSKLDVTRAGSRDSQELADIELKAAQAEAEFAVGAEAEAAAAVRLAGAQKGVEDAATALADSYYTLSGSEVRSALGKATNAADQARAALKAAKDGNMGQDEINRRQAAVNDAANAASDAAQAQIQAGMERTAASKLNSVARGRAEVAKAQQAVAYAAEQYKVGSTEWIQAMSALDSAQLGLVDSIYAQNEAMRQTRVTRVAPGDAVKVARVQLSNARASMHEAARYGRASTQYQSALQAEINAERAVIQAKQAIISARVSLKQAYEQAAGDTVGAAKAGVELAKVQLATAKKNSGGKNSAEVINAKASLVSARAAARDAKLQWELDTIDFNKEMGKITGTEAVKALQEMLKAKNLTEQQRRDIMRKIKGLQDDIRSQLTGSGFNIPGEIKMPTAYQVRRSLAVDAAQNAIVQSVTDVRRMGEMQASSLSAQSVSSSGSSQEALVSAMQAVREAVLANGSQIVNQDVQITTNAPTAAIVRTIVTQVVEELKRQQVSATRSNTSTPRAIR